MKKLLLLTVATATLLSGSLSAFAQGQVTFANTSTTRIRFNDGTPIFGPAGTLEFGLYAGHVGDPSSLTLVGTAFNPAVASSTVFNAGLFSAGNLTLPTAAAFDGSNPIAFQIRAWSANLGSSYEAALANTGSPNFHSGHFGESVIGQVTPAVGPNPVPGLFGTGPGQVGGFNLDLPEPSTLALAGLGAVGWFFFRRRNQ